MKKTKTWLWCKIIPKPNVEQIKSHMNGTNFICMLVRSYSKEKYLRMGENTIKGVNDTNDYT